MYIYTCLLLPLGTHFTTHFKCSHEDKNQPRSTHSQSIGLATIWSLLGGMRRQVPREHMGYDNTRLLPLVLIMPIAKSPTSVALFSAHYSRISLFLDHNNSCCNAIDIISAIMSFKSPDIRRYLATRNFFHKTISSFCRFLPFNPTPRPQYTPTW